MFKLAKSSAIKARAQTINQLKAVNIAADPQLRETLTGLTNLRLIRHCESPRRVRRLRLLRLQPR
jgi:hypothetical protein